MDHDIYTHPHLASGAEAAKDLSPKLQETHVFQDPQTFETDGAHFLAAVPRASDGRRGGEPGGGELGGKGSSVS